jgi:hypothetical protein
LVKSVILRNITVAGLTLIAPAEARYDMEYKRETENKQAEIYQPLAGETMARVIHRK